MNKQILFVHIPKTAGTSFRIAAKEYFGDDKTLFDYGLSSVETSQTIKDHVYDMNDMYGLKQEFRNFDELFLSGHFHVAKYMPLFNTLNVVTFVRNPVEQVFSHYKHFKAHHGYKKDLIDFIQEERFKNIQSKILKAKPLELFGFVGLTEKYAESIDMINDYYDINLEVIEANVASKDMKKVKLDSEIIKLIEKENTEDIKLYEKAKKIFQKRVECFKNSKPYTHLMVQEQKESSIKGVAMKKDNNVAVVDVIDGEKQISLEAKSLRPGMLVHGLPRDGFVGFEYNSKDLNKVRPK